MEATGVYWIPLKDVLESEGLKVDLVKAGDANQLPGREKTDGGQAGQNDHHAPPIITAL
jgi:hypothetical protein